MGRAPQIFHCPRPVLGAVETEFGASARGPWKGPFGRGFGRPRRGLFQPRRVPRRWESDHFGSGAPAVEKAEPRSDQTRALDRSAGCWRTGFHHQPFVGDGPVVVVFSFVFGAAL